jgi:hypothetical protein
VDTVSRSDEKLARSRCEWGGLTNPKKAALTGKETTPALAKLLPIIHDLVFAKDAAIVSYEVYSHLILNNN